MAVTTDIGNIKNIHPKEQTGGWPAAWPCGRSRWHTTKRWSIPDRCMNGLKVEGGKIRVSLWTYVGGGLQAKGDKGLTHFRNCRC